MRKRRKPPICSVCGTHPCVREPRPVTRDQMTTIPAHCDNCREQALALPDTKEEMDALLTAAALKGDEEFTRLTNLVKIRFEGYPKWWWEVASPYFGEPVKRKLGDITVVDFGGIKPPKIN